MSAIDFPSSNFLTLWESLNIGKMMIAGSVRDSEPVIARFEKD